MLGMLAERAWRSAPAITMPYAPAEAGAGLPGSPGADTSAAVMGCLQESLQQFQLRLSARLARYAPTDATGRTSSLTLGGRFVRRPITVVPLFGSVSPAVQGPPRADGAAVRGAHDAAAGRAERRRQPAARRAGRPGALDAEPVSRSPLGGCAAGFADNCGRVVIHHVVVVSARTDYAMMWAQATGASGC